MRSVEVDSILIDDFIRKLQIYYRSFSIVPIFGGSQKDTEGTLDELFVQLQLVQDREAASAPRQRRVEAESIGEEGGGGGGGGNGRGESSAAREETREERVPADLFRTFVPDTTDEATWRKEHLDVFRAHYQETKPIREEQLFD